MSGTWTDSLRATLDGLEKDARDLWNGTDAGEDASCHLEDAAKHIRAAITIIERELMDELAAADPLRRIDGEQPDDFYRRIAVAHTALSRITKTPDAALAQVAQVPRGTASSWVYHARKRGHLPMRPISTATGVTP